MSDLIVKIVQTDLQWEDTVANLSILEEELAMQAGDSVDVIVLPETFNTGFTVNQSAAQMKNGPAYRWMRMIAQRYDCAVCGSLLFRDGDKLLNRFMWMEPSGEPQVYDKRHLFGIGGEGERMTAGDRQVTISYKGWRIRPIVCYDLRFPVWCRNFPSEKGLDYDLLLCVASWPASRAVVWDTLLRARAIENQAYVVGVNRSGTDRDLVYGGGSAVLDFKGQELCLMNDAPFIQDVRLEKESLQRFREVFPAYRDADDFELKGLRD